MDLAWDDLRIVLAVARSATHAAAARALAIDASTVSRRIAGIERALEARLFERTPSGLVPSEVGRLAVTRAERVELELEALSREVRGHDALAAGTLRISAPEGVTVKVLVPALDLLRRAHPGLRLSLRVENRAVDLSRREADVALRLFRPRERGLVAKRVAMLPLGVYAGAAALARRAMPRLARELVAHDWIAFDETLSRSTVSRWIAAHVPEDRIVLRSGSTLATLEACAAGHGLALLPRCLVASDVRLVRVLPRLDLPVLDAWAVVHPDLRRNGRVQAAIEWLERALAGASG